jgi:chitinase
LLPEGSTCAQKLAPNASCNLALNYQASALAPSQDHYNFSQLITVSDGTNFSYGYTINLQVIPSSFITVQAFAHLKDSQALPSDVSNISLTLSNAQGSQTFKNITFGSQTLLGSFASGTYTITASPAVVHTADGTEYDFTSNQQTLTANPSVVDVAYVKSNQVDVKAYVQGLPTSAALLSISHLVLTNGTANYPFASIPVGSAINPYDLGKMSVGSYTYTADAMTVDGKQYCANTDTLTISAPATVALGYHDCTVPPPPPVASGISYDWTPPYEGANTLKIYNNTAQAIVFNKLSFKTSAKYPGSANGSLIVYGEHASTLVENAGTYTLSYSAPYTLAAGSSAYLALTTPGAYGPFKVGMTVDNVQMTDTTGKITSLPIYGACSGAACNDPVPNYRVIGYYTDWDQYARQYDAKSIPVSKVNTINYAFINLNADGSIALIDSNVDYKQLVTIGKLVKQYPYLQAFLSFGGWTKSTNFSAVLNDANKRALFEDQAIAAMQEFGFNGIDIDWEYPVLGPQGTGPRAPEDAVNFGTFVTELRAKLNAAEKVDGKKYYISLAVAAGEDKITQLTKAQWQVVAGKINYLNIMSYDMHGAFDYSATKPQYSIADFQSAMSLDKTDPTTTDPRLSQYSVMASILATPTQAPFPAQGYLAQGFAAKQIIVGIPLYGRMVTVTGLGGDHYGLYQPLASGTAPWGQFDTADSGPTGIFNYSCIVARLAKGSCIGKTPTSLMAVPAGSHNLYASLSDSQWAYNNDNEIVTFDDVPGAVAKATWIQQQHLGGVMYWAFSGDMPISDPQSIIANVSDKLNS